VRDEEPVGQGANAREPLVDVGGRVEHRRLDDVCGDVIRDAAATARPTGRTAIAAVPGAGVSGRRSPIAHAATFL
jgi:hypothetical protein